MPSLRPSLIATDIFPVPLTAGVCAGDRQQGPAGGWPKSLGILLPSAFF